MLGILAAATFRESDALVLPACSSRGVFVSDCDSSRDTPSLARSLPSAPRAIAVMAASTESNDQSEGESEKDSESAEAAKRAALLERLAEDRTAEQGLARTGTASFHLRFAGIRRDARRGGNPRNGCEVAGVS